MAAIITDQLKRQVIQDLFDDITDSAGAKYYIGIGRSQTWNDSDVAPTPINSEREERNFRLNMQSMKRVADYSFVVPRYNWSSGTTYSQYNDNISGYPLNPYYVITEANSVYICIKQARNSAGVAQVSTVEPTGVLTTPFTTSDGYTWKFLYNINTLDASKFLSANYMPVQFVGKLDSDGGGSITSPASYIEQKGVQNAAVAGGLANITITSGGAGYDPADPPSIVIRGDGKHAQASATIQSGVITNIEFNDSTDGVPLLGNDYNFAEVVFSGGGAPTTEAAARPVLAPIGGFGADPRNDLRSTAIMFNVKPEGEEDGEFVVGGAFRQIGIIRNPEIPDSDALYTAISGNALRRLQLAGSGGPGLNIVVGSTITGQTSNAKGIVDKVDSDEVWYHQTETTGFLQFQEAETISDGANTAQVQLVATDADSDAYVEGAVDPFSGKILYIENRAKVDRSTTQTEDIKLIIQI